MFSCAPFEANKKQPEETKFPFRAANAYNKIDFNCKSNKGRYTCASECPRTHSTLGPTFFELLFSPRRLHQHSTLLPGNGRIIKFYRPCPE
jgi:hypothetical protein